MTKEVLKSESATLLSDGDLSTHIYHPKQTAKLGSNSFREEGVLQKHRKYVNSKNGSRQ